MLDLLGFVDLLGLLILFGLLSLLGLLDLRCVLDLLGFIEWVAYLLAGFVWLASLICLICLICFVTRVLARLLLIWRLSNIFFEKGRFPVRKGEVEHDFSKTLVPRVILKKKFSVPNFTRFLNP